MAVILSGAISCTAADTCSFSKIDINPLDRKINDTYYGTLDFLEVRFNNERYDGEVSVFPEPPLVVINNKRKTRCTIDGGIWVRNSVFASGDKSTIATLEFSGSNEHLRFYNTVSCEKTAEVDLSNARWKLEGDKLQILRNKLQNTVSTSYQINSKCKPEIVQKK